MRARCLRDGEDEVLPDGVAGRDDDRLGPRWMRAIDDRVQKRTADRVRARRQWDLREVTQSRSLRRDNDPARVQDFHDAGPRRRFGALTVGSREWLPRWTAGEVEAADQLGRPCRDRGLAYLRPDRRLASAERVKPHRQTRGAPTGRRRLARDRLNRGEFERCALDTEQAASASGAQPSGAEREPRKARDVAHPVRPYGGAGSRTTRSDARQHQDRDERPGDSLAGSSRSFEPRHPVEMLPLDRLLHGDRARGALAWGICALARPRPRRPASPR